VTGESGLARKVLDRADTTPKWMRTKSNVLVKRNGDTNAIAQDSRDLSGALWRQMVSQTMKLTPVRAKRRL
jgi:hypothetical protein